MNKTTGLAIVMVLAFLLGLSMGMGAGRIKHSNLKGQVEQQNRETKNRLKELTRERDIAQARIDKLAKEQEEETVKQKLKLSVLAMSLPIALSGCALKPGSVVVAPKVAPPPIAKIVQETEPRPVGYYQNLILDALQQP